MYINFWYPICRSVELGDAEPLRSRLLGMQFVAFRDSEGNPHVLADTCVHRGGSLSKGRVIDGNVACPYHGWQFAGDGSCAHIPSMESGKAPGRAKVDSYPVQERYGIVFAFLGDLPEAERPPLYEIEEYDDPNWREHEMVILEINCYYERSLENGVDPVHNEFVHPAQGSPQAIEGSVEYPETAWGSGVTGKYFEKGEKRTEDAGMKSDPNFLNAGTWFHGPNTLITKISFAKTASLHQYFFEAPVDGENTKVYFINLRNFRTDPKYDEEIREANIFVTSEDVSILENLYPIRTPDTRTKEILTDGDKAVARYRDFLDDWTSRGWRMDWKAMQANKGDVAFAIPSPARRSAKNWVLDEVPLIAPGDTDVNSAA